MCVCMRRYNSFSSDIGTGAFVAAVKTAAGRDPTILGKPQKYMFDAVTAIHPDINPERTLMIGDRYCTHTHTNVYI